MLTSLEDCFTCQKFLQKEARDPASDNTNDGITLIITLPCYNFHFHRQSRSYWVVLLLPVPSRRLNP